jgi:hypothetical protein
MIRLAAAMILVLASGAVAAAADLETPPGPPRSQEDSLDGLTGPGPEHAPPATDDSWWRKLRREQPDCRSFSDGCRTCDADFKCSNLPIACQPKEWTCLDPKSEPAQ